MRGVVLVALLVGCGFEHGIAGSPASDDGGTDGKTPVMIDAAIDARPIDAAPSPCPDDDADGVCNSVDDWPCGAKPAAAASIVTYTNNSGATSTTISLTNLDGSGVYAVAPANTNISLAFRLQITDTACSSACTDQLELGWVHNNTGNRLGCAYDNTVSKQNGLDAVISATIRTPGTAQAYDLRSNLGQNYSCTANGANNWWGGAVPPETKTIARLCVH